jgi:VacB/RNase II family 3'-5' exoribonuclease
VADGLADHPNPSRAYVRPPKRQSEPTRGPWHDLVVIPNSVSGREWLREIARRAMEERGFEPDFPPAVVAETEALVEPAERPDGPVEDLRALDWVSIDNDDSRDLDQISVAEPLAGGVVRLLVAVADVDAAVRRGSAIDERARTNTTSVYTPAQVFPMLPERLSTDLTSLNQDEDRLAIVVSLEVRPDGTVGESTLSRALVRNKAQLAYDSVAAWLDGNAAAPVAVAASKAIDDQLRLQDGIAGAMKERREHRGALALATTESKAVFDGDLLADLRPDEANRSKEMIQDFMIAANTATARFLEAKGLPSLRRVLKAPERWERIRSLAHDLGESLPHEASAPALQAFLLKRRAKDPERFPDLSLAVIKLLGSGEYGVEVPGHPTDGHFGLAVKDYAHSTAPNRRYPDLVTQRLVKAALAGRTSPYSVAELTELARHCTEQEDDAAKIERQVKKSAAAMLLAPRKGERFDGIVTGASPKGTWVRVFRPPVEGRVVQGQSGLDVGERVRVELLATDVERGWIDFARV